MKILIYEMGSYTYQDIKRILEQMGHNCDTIFYHFQDKYKDDFFVERFERKLAEKDYDFVLSVNFFPLVAKSCWTKGKPYLSWVYDSPLEEGFEDYYGFETNRIFLFDRAEVYSYSARRINTVRHLPLAVDVKRVTKQIEQACVDRAKYSSDVAFVGRLYDSNLETLIANAGDYINGYLDAVIQAQLRIYGYNLIDEMVSDDMLVAINQSLGLSAEMGLNKRGLSFSIASKVTHIERSLLLEELAERHHVAWYTSDGTTLSKSKVWIKNPVKYYSEMPLVFRYSKLNLNPTLRSIQTGIPLRALDIMASQGVLFSNFQVELAEYFEDGKDVIMYSSLEEAIEKADYYLKHDAIREQMAQNAVRKVDELFSYEVQISKMLEMAKDLLVQ